MADTLAFVGSVVTAPVLGSPSGFPSITIPFDERLVLTAMTPSQYALSVDTPVAVAFGGVASAHFVIVKTVGGHVRVRVTSADGATQSFPVDGVLVLSSRTVPITALDLTRDPGVATTVEVFLGQRS